MPTLLKSENVLDIGLDRAADETSDEHFDRGAFARRAIEIVRPRRTTVAICEGASRLRVESGRVWGRPQAAPGDSDERWALLAIPAAASKRAIALAVAGLGHGVRAYALDVLMDEAAGLDGATRDSPSEPSVG